MKNIFYKDASLVKLSLLFAIFLVTSCMNAKKSENSVLQAGFRVPPDSVKLSIYWYWINGNISQEGVKGDLESMAKAGIGRAYIGNIGLGTPHGDSTQQVKLFSKKWWNILEQAFRTADSVGVNIGMFNGPGWSQSGGPWVKPTEAMRYLAHTEFQVRGPVALHEQLKMPDSNFQRTVVLAFPTPEYDGNKMTEYAPHLTSVPQISHASNLIDGNTATEALFPKLPAKDTSLTINLKLDKAMTARSLLLYPAHVPFKADVTLQAKDGKEYKTIKTFQFDRTNANKNVGFMPYSPVVISFPAVEGTEFRLAFSHFSAQGGLSEIELTPRPYLERFVEKQLGKMFQTPHPMWDAYRWPEQHTSYKSSLVVDPDSVQDLTSHVASDGILTWKVPSGEWTIMQMGMLPTGVTNAPATPEATGLEIDKMSKEDLKDHFDAFIGKVLSRIPAVNRKAFKYVVADSYETGSEDWTDGFAKDFQKRYGYSPLPWLPVLSGRIVGSADQADRFLWDMRRLIADRIAYQYVGGLRGLSHQHGLKTWLENYGHWGFPAEFLQYGGQSDEVSGEFWAEGDLGDIELKDASSAAHIYGKNKVYAESFTAAGKTFQRYPGYLKKRGDWAFTQGVNSTLLHVYISQPHDNPRPGINAWFGTEFNRKNTWFNQAKPFFDYMRRCNFMLQQGKPVEDVAYYIGEDAPKMTGIRDPELPEGYSYDYINAEVIEKGLSVKDGKLVLPDGISYSLMVLPPEKTMRPEVLKKISQLVADGATILGPRPERSPSLQDYPRADKEVKDLAAKLWQNCDGKNVKTVPYGKGMVLDGMSMEEAFKLLKVIPDFKIDSDQPVLYTHRKTQHTDIYFVCNQSDTTVNILPSFRVSGKQPEWWDAVDGSMRELPQFTQKGESAMVPLKLEAYQSGFVVFRKDMNGSTGSGNNFPNEKLIINIPGPWKVTFDSAMRGPVQPVVFDQLQDWSTRQEDSIRYYSGTAIYQTTFTVPEIPKDSTIYLNLGKVKVMAQVALNAKDMGGVWTAPRQVDITHAIRKGKNQLTIKVVNTWVNRLIGDSKLPPAERRTHTDVSPYTPDSPLEPSGLMGPVTLKMVRYTK